jgi:PIN domain nuclease of toxin-antitoxin system
MNLLLDTNVLLRWLNGSILPKRLQTQIEKADSLVVSIVTPWELAIKLRRHPSQKLISSTQLWSGLNQMGARILHVQREHVERLASLPDHHHDPFDRMIISQAIQENFTCVSSDERFPLYKHAGLRLLCNSDASMKLQ